MASTPGPQPHTPHTLQAASSFLPDRREAAPESLGHLAQDSRAPCQVPAAAACRPGFPHRLSAGRSTRSQPPPRPTSPTTPRFLSIVSFFTDHFKVGGGGRRERERQGERERGREMPSTAPPPKRRQQPELGQAKTRGLDAIQSRTRWQGPSTRRARLPTSRKAEWTAGPGLEPQGWDAGCGPRAARQAPSPQPPSLSSLPAGSGPQPA